VFRLTTKIGQKKSSKGGGEGQRREGGGPPKRKKKKKVIRGEGRYELNGEKEEKERGGNWSATSQGVCGRKKVRREGSLKESLNEPRLELWSWAERPATEIKGNPLRGKHRGGGKRGTNHERKKDAGKKKR